VLTESRKQGNFINDVCRLAEDFAFLYNNAARRRVAKKGLGEAKSANATFAKSFALVSL